MIDFIALYFWTAFEAFRWFLWFWVVATCVVAIVYPHERIHNRATFVRFCVVWIPIAVAVARAVAVGLLWTN